MNLPPHDPDEVRRIARLARLRLSDEEAERLSRDFGAILGYVDRLRQQEDADDVDPLVHAVPPQDPRATLRDDVPVDDGPAARLAWNTIRALAPDTTATHVQVPKVLEEGR